MTKVRDIVHQIELYAPPSLAEEWDPIGLSFGSYDQEIKKVMIALDLDPHTLEEAVAQNVDMVFTHHPLIFKPVKTLNAEDEKRKLFIRVIREGLAVYSAHTNMDATDGGMNDWLAEKLGLEHIKPLTQSQDERYPGAGLGRVGYLKEPVPFAELLKVVNELFSPSGMRYGQAAEQQSPVKRIAILGGSGASYYRDALRADADVYLTGDIGYHDAQDMLRDGLSFIDPGHYLESIFIEKMTKQMIQWKQEFGWDIEVLATKQQKDVFKYF